MGDEAKKTVLIVDDEPLVRMHLADLLGEAGYRLREASCAAEAIEILERDPEIRVVFTDIQMPGTMDGLALAHYVRKRWPPTVLVICSGNIAPKADDLPSDAEFFAKPFSGADVGQILKRVELKLAAS